MPHKKRSTKGTAKMKALLVSKSSRQQIPSAIRYAATILSEISGNSLLSIGKSLDNAEYSALYSQRCREES